MISFLLASTIIAQPISEDPAVRLCKPVLARLAGGQIATIDISSARYRGRSRTIEGRLTAFVGMGPPSPGTASAHHLIRSDFTYRCRVSRGRVRAAAVNPLSE